MRVLVACEYSGEVRRAFANRGHTVVSCDLLPADDGCWVAWSPHGTGWMRHVVRRVEDVLYYRQDDFDLMIAFPPCTDLASSGARWFAEKRANGSQQRSVDFFMSLVNAPIPQIAIENPVGIMSSEYRKPDQIVQPWQFGHGETKSTCLWLKNLPKLEPTNIVGGREQRIWKMGPSPTRWKERSKTYSGIAQAMAQQWG
jgi:site-specific DNA-cytosine methylase